MARFSNFGRCYAKARRHRQPCVPAIDWRARGQRSSACCVRTTTSALSGSGRARSRRASCSAATGSRRALCRGTARARRRAGARAAARRGPDRVPRHATGSVGLVDAFCPHRRAPLFFGRNEECGLRCVYHGWKFDVDGACVDMPSEPPDSPVQDEGRGITAYPTVERGGMVWAYLGPPRRCARPRPTTNGRARRRRTASSRRPSRLQLAAGARRRARHRACRRSCTTTASATATISSRATARRGSTCRDRLRLSTTSRTRKIDAERRLRPRLSVHDAGAADAAQRHADGARRRMHACRAMTATSGSRSTTSRPGSTTGCAATTPTAPLDPDDVERARGELRPRRATTMSPARSGSRPISANDYFIDRAVQKTKSFTGINGINTQDMALQEGMGADRRPHAGTSRHLRPRDRRHAPAAARGDARGRARRGAAGLDPASHRAVRPHDGIVPAGADWRAAFAQDWVRALVGGSYSHAGATRRRLPSRARLRPGSSSATRSQSLQVTCLCFWSSASQ